MAEGRRRRARAIGDVARAQQKTFGVATTAVTGLVIAWLTLTPGGGPPTDHFERCVTCGSYWASDFGLNLLLFIPLGFGLRIFGMRRWTAIAVAVATTVTIETLQYHVIAGRDSDLSDILSNTVGGVVGVILADGRRQLVAPPAAVAARLAAAGAVLWCIAAALTQWILAVSLPQSVYYGQVAPRLGQFAVFDGMVSNASFNGAPFRPGRLSIESSAAMRNALVTGDARIAAAVLGGTPRRRLAPILSVFDRERREIFVLGQRRNDLVFRIRRRSDGWGFHSPSLTLVNALLVRSNRDDTVHIDATMDGGAPRLRAASPAGLDTRRIGAGIWELWRLLLPDDDRFGDYAMPITVLWAAAMFAPLGFWGACGFARAPSHTPARILSAVAPAIVTVFAALAIIPWAARSPAAPWPVWGASVVGAALAWAIARWLEPIVDVNL
jgi:VanZ like family